MSPQHNWILTGVFFVAVCAGYSGSASGDEGTFEVLDTAGFAQQFFSDGTDESETIEDVESEGVSVTSYDTVSLNVQNTDLADVLQVLSVQGKRNIVPSPQVNGSVTANLYDVTFYEALDAILQQNGAGYREKGNFIYVYTMDELEKIEQAERRVDHKIITLNYITATDASTFVSPLLSSAGSIAISGNVAPGFEPSLSDGGADTFANAHTMIVRDYPENIAEIEKVIAALDVRPVQVMVEAVILKADVNSQTEFGVDYSILTNQAVAAAGAITNPVGTLAGGLINEGVAIGNNVPQVDTTSTAGFQVGIVSNKVAAFITALDTVTDTTIVAKPKLLALNRQRAEVLVGEKIGYLSTTATSTATTQTVEFLDTGTQLTMRPFVSNDGYIRLELKPQLSSANIRSVTSTGAAAVTVPDEITQELTTNVIVQDGQTVVLGGLFKEETNIGRDQVPYLGDLPLAGYAFRGQDDESIRTEVIFLITPHIVKDQSLYASGDSAMDGIEMVRIGAREGLLPFSKSKLTAGHLRDALRAIEAGDRETALWEVDMALGIDPTQIEAIRLKEKLVGQRSYWPNNSLLDQAVDQMVEDATGERQYRARPMNPDPRPSQPITDGEPLMSWDQPIEGTFEVVETTIDPETTTVQIDEALEAVEQDALEDGTNQADETVETAEVEESVDIVDAFETETEMTETETEVAEQTEEGLNETTEETTEVAEQTEEGLNETTEETTEVAEQAEEGLNETTEETTEVAEQTEEGLNETTEETTEVTEQTEEGLNETTEETTEVAEQAEEGLNETTEETTEVTEQTEEGLDEVTEETTEVAEQSEEDGQTETTGADESVEIVEVEETVEPTDSVEDGDTDETQIETVEVLEELSSTQDEPVMPAALRDAIRNYYQTELDTAVVESIEGYDTAEVESVE